MNAKYKYLGKNTLIFALSSFGTKFLAFLLVPLYTNILSPEEYGIADLITITATLLIYVLTINIADSVLRFTLERQTNQSEILSYGVRVLIVGSLWCALGLGGIYFSHILPWPTYYYLFVLLYFSFTATYQLLTNYLRGIDKVTHVAVAGIVSSVVILISNLLLLIVFETGIIGYLISLTLGPLLASIYCIAVICEPLKSYFVNSCNAKTMREMREYCIPLIFNNLAVWVVGFLDRYFVTAFCGVGENGIYSVAYKIPVILATCYMVFSQAWNLSAIKEFDAEDKDGFFSKTYSVYNALISIVCSVLILFNIPLAHFLYQKEFFGAWQYSSVLLISVMFNSLTVILGSIFSVVKETKVIAGTTILSAAINTILNAVLIPLIGALGAAIATAVAFVVLWAVRLWLSRRYIHFNINIFSSCLTYVILCLQVVLEHIQGKFDLCQILCLAIVVYVNWKYLMVLLSKATNVIKQRCKR